MFIRLYSKKPKLQKTQVSKNEVLHSVLKNKLAKGYGLMGGIVNVDNLQ